MIPSGRKALEHPRQISAFLFPFALRRRALAMSQLPGLSGCDDRLKRLSDLGDQLEAFGRAVDFEIFRPDLAAALNYSTGERGGRP